MLYIIFSLWISTGEDAINLYGEVASPVLLRVYKITDPIGYFKKLKDIDRPVSPNQQKEKSLLDLLRDGVNEMRKSTRFYVRGTLRSDIRYRMIKSFDIKPFHLNKRYKFIPPPKLKYKLVMEKYIKSDYEEDYVDEEIPFATKRGLYLIEVSTNQGVYSKLWNITDLEIEVKNWSDRLLILAHDMEDGGITKARVFLYNRKRWKSTGINGIKELKVKDTSLYVLATSKKGFAMVKINRGYSTTTRAYIYTERPIYRPGHTVYFKGILRDIKDNGYSIPSKKGYTIVIKNPSYNSVLIKDIELNKNGTFNDSLLLPDNCELGFYSIELLRDGKYMASSYFMVEEYRKPEFKVDVETDREYAFTGESIEVVIKADYFWGKPVDGECILEIYESSGWWGSEYLDSYSFEIKDGIGRVTIPVETESRYIELVARVTDISSREYSGSKRIEVLKGYVEPFISIEKGYYYINPGSEFYITVKTRNSLTNKPVSARVEVGVEEYDNSMEKYRIIKHRTVRTDENGFAQVPMTIDREGDYYVYVITEDERGRRWKKRRYVWVWSGREYKSVQEPLVIFTDKENYFSGEDGELSLITSGRGYALITVETNGINWYKLKKINEPLEKVVFPVPSKWNKFKVKVVYYGETKNVKSKLLNIIDSSHVIFINSDIKRKYYPGENVTLNFILKDGKGRRVDGEMSVGVVDEAIYALRQREEEDIFKFFFERVTDASTSTSLYYYFYTNYDEFSYKRIREKRHLLASYKEGEMGGIRKIFKDVAYWNPQVKVRNGFATVSFKLPDNLTTWRINVKAVSKAEKFGEKDIKFLVTKDVAVQPVLPRFLRVGDSADIPFILFSNLNKETSYNLSLYFNKVNKKFTSVIKPNASKVHFIKVKPLRRGKAKIKANVKAENLTDKVELNLPIIPRGLPFEEKKTSIVMGNGEAELEIDIPQGVSYPEIELILTPGLYSTFVDGVLSLIEYPYGCVEQTMSCLIPDIMAYSILKKEIKDFDIERIIEKGLTKIYGYQHEDGGWGWWSYDETDAYMTHYVLDGLKLAIDNGWDVPEGVIEKGLNSLISMLDEIQKYREVYIEALHTLVEYGKVKEVESYIDMAQPDDALSAALMIDIYKKLGRDDIEEFIKIIEKEAIHKEGMTYWRGDIDWWWWFFDDSVERTGRIISILSKYNLKPEMVKESVKYLLSKRQGKGWGSTLETAQVLMALYPMLERDRQVSTVDLYLDGRKIVKKNIDKTETLKRRVKPGKHTVRVIRKGRGIFILSTVVSFYSSDKNLLKNMDAGICNIERRFYKNIEGELEEVDASSIELGDDIVIEITLKVNKEADYMVMEIPMAACFEVRRDADLTTFYDDWFWYPYEIHDTYTSLFYWWLYPEEELTFYLEVVPTLKGRFYMPPVKLYEMYNPSRVSFGTPDMVLVK